MGQTDARVLTDKAALRDAATIIVLREDGGTRRVLMGQRGKSAAFHAVEIRVSRRRGRRRGRHDPAGLPPSAEDCASRLAAETDTPADAVIAAATRGVVGGNRPPARRGRSACGNSARCAAGMARIPRHRTSARWRRAALHSSAPSRRPAARAASTRVSCWPAPRICATIPDDFSRAEDELSHLQWVPLEEARRFDMPFITEVVLAELDRDPGGTRPSRCAVFSTTRPRSAAFRRL